MTTDTDAKAPRDDVHDTRWSRLKFGLMMHWGLYSVAGGVWRGRQIPDYNEQIKHRAEIPWDEYVTLCDGFTADAWDPDAIAQLAVEAGTRYVVITSKHHDGFCLWPTELSELNAAAATPAGRDVLEPLAVACARHGLGFGLYYSLIDWHYPGARAMSDHNSDPITPALEAYTVGQLRELLTNYGPLCEMWFDMAKPTARQSKTLAELVHGLQPACRVSGRVWNGQHDFMECGDNETPDQWFDGPWESAVTMFHETWGYRSWQERGSVEDKVREKVRDLAFVTAKGGNYLLNIGPRGDGSIHEFDAAVLRGIGGWMKTHGEAIYEGEPEPFLELEFGYAVSRPGRLWLYVAKPPADGVLRVPGWTAPLPSACVLAEGDAVVLQCALSENEMSIQLPAEQLDANLTVVAVDHEGAKPFLPAGLVRLDPDGPSVLERGNSHAWHRMDGGDYYSLRKFVTRRTWHVLSPRGGTCRLTVRRADGGDPAGFAIAAGPSRSQFVLPESRASQEHVCDELTLEAGAPLAVELTSIVPGAELADIGLSLVLESAG